MSQPELVNRVQAAFEDRGDLLRKFLKQRNIVGVGIGYKMVNGELTDTPSVVFSVAAKKPRQDLPESELLPDHVDDLPTDVVEIGEVVALGLNRRGVNRPIRPGMSVGHMEGVAGTIGAMVRRGGETFILSNNHVLARENQAKVGDPIIQPGRSDGGMENNVVAELDSFTPLTFESEAAEAIEEAQVVAESPRGCSAFLSDLLPKARERVAEGIELAAPGAPGGIDTSTLNTMDAALARILPGVTFNLDIIDAGGPPTGIATPELGMPVLKSGRTTGLTTGTITQIAVSINVRYPAGGVARFRNQVIVTPFSQSGDSGSLVLDYQRRAVGLLFSGSEQVSVMTPIEAVLKRLQVTLLLS
ncbi:MAG: hypothetical protein GYB68_13725 [Chloroflexi bacterium]|nr:hypothetical protein [Chloroflexota bacterium]